MRLKREAQSIVDAEKGMVLATVEIAATPERVFEALVRSEDVLRWWRSDESARTMVWEADVREGGKWHAAGKLKDGSDYTIDGEFIEVERPHRLGFTWRPSWDAPHVTQVTYALEAIDSGTRLTLRHEGFGERTEPCRGHGNGWARVLTLLENDLRRETPQDQHFLFRLLPPRPTFMKDMTEDELMLMRVHSVYWRGQLAAGKIVAFGPVVDANGGWGMGLLRVDSAEEADRLMENDPVILADKGFRSEKLPMPSAVYA